jgi:hypothetical protein
VLLFELRGWRAWYQFQIVVTVEDSKLQKKVVVLALTNVWSTSMAAQRMRMLGTMKKIEVPIR